MSLITYKHQNTYNSEEFDSLNTFRTFLSNSLNISLNNLLLTTRGKILKEENFESKNLMVDISIKLKGGRALSANDKELVKRRTEIQVCYKCNGRMKLTMTHCRKKSCSYDNKIRKNKKRRQVGKK